MASRREVGDKISKIPRLCDKVSDNDGEGDIRWKNGSIFFPITDKNLPNLETLSLFVWIIDLVANFYPFMSFFIYTFPSSAFIQLHSDNLT